MIQQIRKKWKIILIFTVMKFLLIEVSFSSSFIHCQKLFPLDFNLENNKHLIFLHLRKNDQGSDEIAQLISKIAELRMQIDSIKFSLKNPIFDKYILINKLEIEFNQKYQDLVRLSFEKGITEIQIKNLFMSEIYKSQNHNESKEKLESKNNFEQRNILKKTFATFNEFKPKEIYNIYHNEQVVSSVFTLDNKYLITASFDYTAKVTEVATGKEVHVIHHHNWLKHVAISPDGKYVITTSSDQTAKIVEIGTWKEVHVIEHDAFIGRVLFSPDGKYMITISGDNTAKIIELNTWKELGVIDHCRLEYPGWLIFAAFSLDGKYLVTTSSNGISKVIEVGTWKELQIIKKNKVEDFPNSIIVSPDNQHLLVSLPEGIVKFYKIGVQKKISIFKTIYHKFVKSIVNQWSVIKEIKNLGNSPIISFSLDGKYFLVSSFQKGLHVFEVSSWKEVFKHPGQFLISSRGFSSEGKYFVVSSGISGSSAKIIEFGTWREVYTIHHQDSIFEAVFSSDNQYLATGSKDKTVKLIHLYDNFEIE